MGLDLTPRAPFGALFLVSLLTACLFLPACAAQSGASRQADAMPAPSQPAAPPPPAYQPAAKPGGLVDGAGAPLPFEAFAERARQVDYVLVGEEHATPCHHRMQAELLAVMAQTGNPPVLGLEQVSVDRQAILDDFAQGRLTPEELPEALDWAETWGHDYTAYAPLFLTARHFNLPLAALNVPRDIVRQVSRQGLASLSPADRALLPERIVPPLPEQEKELREFFTSHSQLLHKEPGSGQADPAASFLLIQSLWDTMMAKQAMAAHARFGRPVLIAAGIGHVEAGWGVAHRLRVFDPAARALVVMPWTGQQPPDPADADVFYYCPAAPAARPGQLGVRLEPTPEGLRVEEVQPGSRAERAGLQNGDVIARAGGAKAESAQVLREAAITALRGGHPLVLELLRHGQPLALEIQMAAPARPVEP